MAQIFWTDLDPQIEVEAGEYVKSVVCEVRNVKYHHLVSGDRSWSTISKPRAQVKAFRSRTMRKMLLGDI